LSEAPIRRPTSRFMTRTPLLSIGLFVYNGESFLRQTLDSILGQTFRDFELIISDNASTDATQEICESYARDDSRIRYSRSDVNMGAGWNIRRVFSLARSKYFKWAACDDLYEPTFLEKCINDSSFVLAHARTRIIDERGEFLELYNWPMRADSPRVLTRFREMLLNDHMCYQIFGVMRRDALLKVPPQGSYVNSDGVLLAQLSFLGRFYEDPEFLFISRRHDSQSSQTLPVRLKKRRFRLTNRHGTLPSPEWWDPQKSKSLGMPEWRQLREYWGSIMRAPLSFPERVRSLLLLGPWIVKHFRRMMKDVLIAADQVLYNVQMSQMKTRDLREARKTA
jgi:glycosyltransferase involved in cell wall biosynthesis